MIVVNVAMRSSWIDREDNNILASGNDHIHIHDGDVYDGPSWWPFRYFQYEADISSALGPARSRDVAHMVNHYGPSRLPRTIAHPCGAIPALLRR